MGITADTGPSFSLIRPQPPRSPEVASFFETHPEFDVSSSLEFVTQHYPDVSDWIVDSGIAVQILTGRREQQPSDLDIVCRDPEMEEDFGRSSAMYDDRRYIDVKSLDHWLLGRGEVRGDQSSLWEYVSALSIPMDVGGHTIQVMHPALIAATKSTVAKMEQRPKDLADIELLAVSPGQIEAATALLRGHEPEKQFEFLMNSSPISDPR